MLNSLLAMQQADSAFPSGAFAFSNGIEGLAALPYAFDRDALKRHAEAAIRHRWAGTDRVAMIVAHRADGDLDRLETVDRAIEAATLPESMRTGSRRAGRALLTTHARLGTLKADGLRTAIAGGASDCRRRRRLQSPATRRWPASQRLPCASAASERSRHKEWCAICFL